MSESVLQGEQCEAAGYETGLQCVEDDISGQLAQTETTIIKGVDALAIPVIARDRQFCETFQRGDARLAETPTEEVRFYNKNK